MIAKTSIDLDALKQSTDLLALVRSRGFKPKRHGTGKWKINCPFHADEEASLVITPGKNLWHCFGCDKGGSAIDLVKDLDPLVASTIVLTQLLPLPLAAAIFFLVARRMSHEIDRKIRGIGELQLMLNNPDSATTSGYASVDQVYQRSRERFGLAEGTL